VDNILKPVLIGQGAQIPVFLLMFSVLGGLALYGVIGIFLGPILAGLLITTLQIYREEYSGRDASPAPASESD
jgi:predicted PurR-regulated permease PerM